MSSDNDKTQLPEDSGKANAQLSEGQLFGQYTVIRLLGRGGMGEVYEVEHSTLGTRHALKLINQEIVERSDARERFKREARVMAKLRHEHIVHVDDFGESDGRIWLRMDLLEGWTYQEAHYPSLQELMRAKGALPGELVERFLRQILQGLRLAHDTGAVHRDLKPANLLLDAEGNVKISDFGLVSLAGADWLQSQVQLTVARSMADPDATRLDSGGRSVGTSTQALLGTFAYMSPEQKKGSEVDHRSDLYAVGLIGFQMLTGEETAGFEMPSELVSGLDVSWDDWVKCALAVRLDRRVASAAELLGALPESSKEMGLSNLHSTFSINESSPQEAKTQAARKRELIKAPVPVERKRPDLGKDHALILSEDCKLELKWIEPGSFIMGSPKRTVEGGFMGIGGTVKQEGEVGRSEDEREHSVTLSQGYWLGKYTVTQGQWESVMGSNPSEFKGRDLPVEQVSWKDAMGFCRQLTESERSAGRLAAGYEYSLPSESQWEYACRAETTGLHAGDLDEMGWYNENSGSKTHAVGTKRANAWGLYDMHGNVWEWCSDWYGSYPSGSAINPVGASSGSLRVVRGGCWYYSARNCRSAFRSWSDPGSRNNDLGFRLALSSIH